MRKKGLVLYTVTDDASGIRLDRWIHRFFPDWPHGYIHRLLRTKHIRLDGKRAPANIRLRTGQQIAITAHHAQQQTTSDNTTEISPGKRARLQHRWEKLKKAIVYHDQWILVLSKPSGLPTQGGTKQAYSVDLLLRYGLATDHPPSKPFLVHRLDRETTGLLVIALSAFAAARLSEAFRTRRVEKIYHACLTQTPDPPKGVIDTPLKKGALGKMILASPKDPEALSARTHYAVLKPPQGSYTWVQFKPHTGRMHQLRIHAAEGLKCPILGDGKYGTVRQNTPVHARQNKPLPLHLHAFSLTFPHPATQKPFTLTAPLPEALQKTWDQGPQAHDSSR